MKTKASVLTIRVPNELKHKIEQVADQQGVSINQLALYVFTKEIENIEAYRYFESYWKGKTKKRIYEQFDQVMAKVKKQPVPEWDKIDN